MNCKSILYLAIYVGPTTELSSHCVYCRCGFSSQTEIFLGPVLFHVCRTCVYLPLSNSCPVFHYSDTNSIQLFSRETFGNAKIVVDFTLLLFYLCRFFSPFTCFNYLIHVVSSTFENIFFLSVLFPPNEYCKLGHSKPGILSLESERPHMSPEI